MAMKLSVHFSKAWEWWKRVGRKIGDIQARIILTVFYFLVVGPFALVVRAASDPLSLKAGAARGWLAGREDRDSPLERASRQF